MAINHVLFDACLGIFYSPKNQKLSARERKRSLRLNWFQIVPEEH